MEITNLRFTISVYMNRLDIFAGKEISQNQLSTGTSYHNTYINVGDKILKVYEQLPIICDDIHLSTIIDPKTGEIISGSRSVLEDYNNKFFSFELDGSEFEPHYKPHLGEIRYGYEYTKDGVEYKNNSYTTEQDRNIACLKETGINFESVDYSDRLHTTKSNPEYSKK